MITSEVFGTLRDGTQVTCWTIRNHTGGSVSVLDYGGTVQSIVVPDRSGLPVDVVLGYDTVTDYETQSYYAGATIGRHGNRIGKGCFELNGKSYQLCCNNGPNHNHGGPVGFDRKLFTAEVNGDVLRMHLVSPDGDQGYPGTLQLTVEFSLSEENSLKIHYLAEADQDTLCNLTNHSYFDLSGGANPMGQILQVDAEYITENDENTLPTGRYLPVAGTPFDFRQGKPIETDLHDPLPQLSRLRGYDHNFVLDKGSAFGIFASLYSPETGILMTAETDLPGLQVYSASYMEKHAGKGGRSYYPWCAVALETQSFPNGMAIAEFPSPVLRKGEVYDHTTVYSFKTQV